MEEQEFKEMLKECLRLTLTEELLNYELCTGGSRVVKSNESQEDDHVIRR